METLRTPNLYPIADYAEKIASSIIELISDDNDRCIDLFFDDKEMSVAEIPAAVD